MPFGAPVVPDENMITNGVLNGTCLKVKGKSEAPSMKSSKSRLLGVRAVHRRTQIAYHGCLIVVLPPIITDVQESGS